MLFASFLWIHHFKKWFKPKSLPADLILLIIDDLDSPTMMSCREVCKEWLSVVEENRSLSNFFHLQLQHKEDRSSIHEQDVRSLDLKIKKWHSGTIIQSRSELYERDIEYQEIIDASKAFFGILLKSKSSLRVWSHTSWG